MAPANPRGKILQTTRSCPNLNPMDGQMSCGRDEAVHEPVIPAVPPQVLRPPPPPPPSLRSVPVNLNTVESRHQPTVTISECQESIPRPAAPSPAAAASSEEQTPSVPPLTAIDEPQLPAIAPTLRRTSSSVASISRTVSASSVLPPAPLTRRGSVQSLTTAADTPSESEDAYSSSGAIVQPSRECAESSAAPPPRRRVSLGSTKPYRRQHRRTTAAVAVQCGDSEQQQAELQLGRLMLSLFAVRQNALEDSTGNACIGIQGALHSLRTVTKHEDIETVLEACAGTKPTQKFPPAGDLSSFVSEFLGSTLQRHCQLPAAEVKATKFVARRRLLAPTVVTTACATYKGPQTESASVCTPQSPIINTSMILQLSCLGESPIFGPMPRMLRDTPSPTVARLKRKNAQLVVDLANSLYALEVAERERMAMADAITRYQEKQRMLRRRTSSVEQSHHHHRGTGKQPLDEQNQELEVKKNNDEDSNEVEYDEEDMCFALQI
eukprot:NODE_884_length_1845_cov_27.312918_g784_i0.p1 GENE.NODE_884_length_1845_cov_27.312918_g784_i0~~NODE_884_length_1845_cov_27.312918_g784_i0.p1  ORF type:complete len:509 (-),score=84.46 NODE_884_length_1845_cov_27.312918_g784_i0:317-1801(-)